MQKQFREHILKFIDRDDKLLVGVSGGRDSIALLDICIKSGLDCAVAHCNFHLRGQESDEDEQFVKCVSEKYGVPFFKVDFDTKKIADNRKWSIQEAARNLRFEWFDELLSKYGYSKILLAQHKNDQAETMLFNLVRGSGVKGLIGIRDSRDEILRPLLIFSRKEVDEYLKENKLSFREDSSNLNLKYNRNFIRQEVIPKLEKVNPAALNNIVGFGEKLKDYELIVSKRIMELRQSYFDEEGDGVKIDKELWNESDSCFSLTYELLKDYGFKSEQVHKIHQSVFGVSGKKFYSDTFEILIDRAYLFLKKAGEDILDSDWFTIDNVDDKVEGYTLAIKEGANYHIPKNVNIGCFDLDRLEFPLVCRKWKKGDKFHPLGMKGKKLVSDLLVDLKLNLFEKEKIYVLESARQIIWVVGLRLDDRFKVTSQSSNILEIEKIIQ